MYKSIFVLMIVLVMALSSCQSENLTEAEEIEEPGIVFEKPQNFEEMKALAAKMSADLPAIRIDLYDVNGKIYFGEYTLYSASGFGPFHPEEWDEKIGAMIPLP